MSFRPFTSESYSEDDRPEAWRDVLRAVGLQQFAAAAASGGYATASRRHAEGIVLAKLAAGSQTISPLASLADDMPLLLMPIDEGVALRTGAGHQIISAGQLLLLPRRGDWSIAFQRDMRALVLSVTSEAFHGRKTGQPALSDVHVLAPGGFTDVFSRTLESTGNALETLSDTEWTALAQSLADLVPVFREIYESASDNWRLYEACEELVDLEDNFQFWRFRHLRTVQRTIGMKTGTGGSSGVDFLQRALSLTFFPELFAVRTEIGA